MAASNLIDSMGEGMNDIADKIGDKSKVARMIFVVSSIPTFLAVCFMAIPVGCSEVIFNEVRQKLKDGKFDKEMIPLAQKQILQIALCNYIKDLQIRYAR